MKKRLLALLLVLVMIASLLESTACATGITTSSISGTTDTVQLVEDNALTISGSFTLGKEAEEGAGECAVRLVALASEAASADAGLPSDDTTITGTDISTAVNTKDSFSDDTSTGTWLWAGDYIYACADAGIINGYSDGTFLPDDSLTRAEAATIIARAFELSSDSSESSFSDISSAYLWAQPYIEACVDAGIINGYADGTFLPGQNVTRAEMAKMIAAAKGLALNSAENSFSDVTSVYLWAQPYIEACVDAGIINGYSDGTFLPASGVTRAEAATMIARALNLLEEEVATDSDAADDVDMGSTSTDDADSSDEENDADDKTSTITSSETVDSDEEDDAASVLASGTCGDDLTWVLTSDGTLTISGTGNMDDYSGRAPWYSYIESIASVDIESGVTSIGEKAFHSCTSLTNIDIPDSVTSIGYAAFGNCFSLTSVTIPEGVSSLGDYAFISCSSLKSVDLSDTDVTSIGVYTFYACTNLTNVELGNVSSIGGRAFMYCESLSSVSLSSEATSIGDYAFSHCDSLTSVDLGGATEIGESAFGACYSLTDITIPDSVTYIGKYAFSNCTGLTSITISKSVTDIDTHAFEGCTSLTDVYYAGSNDDWAAISIGDGNSCLTSATINCAG